MLKQALISECQAAWNAAIAGTEIDGYIVQSVLPISPSNPAVFLSAKRAYPALCIQRENSVIDEATLSKLQRTTTWGIWFILPELDDEGIGKLYDLLTLAETVIINTIERGGHPDFYDGYQALGDAGFHWWQIIQSQVLNLEFVTENQSMVLFPAIKLTLRTVERDVSEFEPVAFEGTDISIGLVSGIDGYADIDPWLEARTTF